MFGLIFIIFFLFTGEAFSEGLKANYEIWVDLERRIIKGNGTLEFDKEGFYEISKGNLVILNLVLNNKSLEIPPKTANPVLKIYNSQKKGSLFLSFEKPFSLTSFPFKLKEFLPFSRDPTLLDLKINILNKKEEIKVFFPCPSNQIQEGESYLCSISQPLSQSPPLIIGKFKELRIFIEEKEFLFLIPEDFSFNLSEKFILGAIKDLKDFFLFQPVNKYWILLEEEKENLPFTLSLPLSVTKENFKEFFLEALVEHNLYYGFNLRSPLLKGLKIYFSSYFLSPKKEAYRKQLLIEDSLESQSFFYFYEWIERIGEEKFQNFWRFYSEKYFGKESNNENFLRVAGDYFKVAFPSWETFEKIKIEVKTDLEFLPQEKKYHLKILLSRNIGGRPLKIEGFILTPKERRSVLFYLDGQERLYEFYLEEKPLEIVLDPYYKVFRKLEKEEKAWKYYHLKEGKLIIYLSRKDLFPVYREFLEDIRKKEGSLKFETPSWGDLPQENIIFLDSFPQNFHWEIPKEGVYFKILPHPKFSEFFIAFLKISSLKDWKEFKKKKGEVINFEEFYFKKGKFLVSIPSKEREGLVVNLKEEFRAYGIERSQLKSLKDFVPKWLSLQAFLIGEVHNRYEHHLFQLEVIKTLYNYYKDLVIGLEMVQAPFQKYLDEFIEGKLSEKELLEKIEYFERWKFDYNLYRDIFLWAKEKKIRLWALDVPQEIVKKVSKEGFLSLSPEEKMLLPELDLDQPAYKEYLRKIYEKHKFETPTNFEYFYQAQVLRDSWMAERIVEFLRANPSKKMIVLVGKGHLINYYGIPTALKSRNFHNFKTILLGEHEELIPSLGDYWFFPSPKEYEQSPQLGVDLEETFEGLKIKKVLKESLAEKVGLKVGDFLLKADSRDLRKISDLRLELTFKRKGEKLLLTIKREEKILRIEVNL